MSWLDYEYRGLDNAGEWEYGGVSDKLNMIVRGYTFLPIRPETLCKNTHCRDRKGFSAFENDIVVSNSKDIPSTPLVIKYLPNTGKFVMQGNNVDYDLEEGTFELRGNIFQHPELLK